MDGGQNPPSWGGPSDATDCTDDDAVIFKTVGNRVWVCPICIGLHLPDSVEESDVWTAVEHILAHWPDDHDDSKPDLRLV